MKYFSRGNKKDAQARLLGEELFREGLWAKALANSDGN
ncbi:MAG: hypothetical protein ACI89D_002063 [Bermanella sp.]|jgi:hypothetical protein